MRRGWLALLLVMAARANAQGPHAPDMFKDVPKGHWAYGAAAVLQDVSFVLDNVPYTRRSSYFGSNRVLTRYEFAVILDRALKLAPAAVRVSHYSSQASVEAMVAQAIPAIALVRLVTEFREELVELGATEDVLKNRVRRAARILLTGPCAASDNRNAIPFDFRTPLYGDSGQDALHIGPAPSLRLWPFERDAVRRDGRWCGIDRSP